MFTGQLSPILEMVMLAAVGGTILCLIFLWMLRQQKFLHELSHTLLDLEQRTREAQRDLFLILSSHLGLSGIPVNGSRAETEPRAGSLLEHKPAEIRDRNDGLSIDEVRLLMVLAGGTESGTKYLTDILRRAKGFHNVDSTLRSLRDKEFIFYSDYTNTVVILPKGQRYIGLLRS